VDLEQARAELYGAAPEDFVAERKRLAKELKAEGQAEDAQELAKVRKPTLSAWALNRLTRDERRDVDLLLDSGHRLLQAQAGVLRGDARDAFEQAQRTEREAIARLVHEAEQLLVDRGGASATVLEQIAASLHAAAVSEHGRELLAAGQFTEPLTLEGFDTVAGLAPPPSKRPAKPPAKPKPSRSTEELRRARAALSEAKKRLHTAERTAHEAHRLAAHADAEVEAAAEAVRNAEQRLRG
jgi:hypothetical protein